MTLDLVVLGCLLFFAVRGAMRGALRQLLGLAAVVVGWIAARSIGPSVALGFSEKVPAFVAGPIATILIFFSFSILIGIVGRFFLRAGQRAGVVRGAFDRMLGAVLGAVMSGIVLWVLMSAWVLLGVRLGGLDPKDSRLGRLVREHNLLVQLDLPPARVLVRLIEAAKDPAAVVQMRRDADTRQFLDDPRVQALVNGPGLAPAAAGSEGLSPEAVSLLSDPAVIEQLKRIAGKLPLERAADSAKF